MTITKPEEVVRDIDNPRMPTFEEFVWLYVHYRPRIHEVINKLTPGFQTSFRISSDLSGQLAKMGLRGYELVMSAPAWAKTEEDILFVGDVVTFVPPRSRTSAGQRYFVISHPFDISKIQEKLAERGQQTSYIDGILETRLVKTLCLTHPAGGYVLVSLHGNSQVDWKKLAYVLDFSRVQREKMKQHEGSLEEALGMAFGKVTPLVPADKLSNLAAVVIDAGLDSTAQSGERAPYFEIPLNVDGTLITSLNQAIFNQWRKDIRHWNDLTRNRETTLAYNPENHSLAGALRNCYSAEKVLVASITK